MTFRPPMRIAVAISAAILFVFGLAYWWQGNLFHEIVGTIFLVLLIVHNVTVLRWYTALSKGKWNARRKYSTATNLLVLLLMVTLAVTSIVVSQTLFSSFPGNVGFSAREVHVLVSYWALIVMGLHLGLHWSRVLAVVRSFFDYGGSKLGAAMARLLALGIAAFGIHSLLVMMLPEKLFAVPALEMWDFTVDAGGFFLRYGAIVGLFVVIGHYLAVALQARRGAPTRG